MTTKPKLSDMTGYEADDVMVIERKTYEELLAALKALQLQALQSTVNDGNEYGQEALAMTAAAIAKAEGR